MSTLRAALGFLVILTGACGGEPAIEPSGGARGGSAGSSGGVAPVRPGGNAGASGTGGGPRGSTGGSENPACAATMANAEPVPVDIFIMLDKSGSMLEPAAVGMMTKWDAVKAALAAFVQSPDTAGLTLGMGLFPLTTGVVARPQSVCMNAAYATPVVPMGALPAAGTAVVGVLNMTIPVGGTPTNPALQGAIQYAQSWQMTSGRRVAIALVTDGQPNDCQSSVPAVSNTAMMAAGTGLLTFVIGVGPSLQNLNAIAVAGGTNMAYLVDNGSVDAFIAAFKTIQSQAAKLACTFAVPAAPSGMTMLDPTKVNVTFTVSGNPADAKPLPQVADRAACGMAGGWFYDNPTAPTNISLCPVSCMLANSSPMGRISLEFGCKTRVIE